MKRNGVIGIVLLAATVACGLAFAASTDEMSVRRELQAWYGKIVDAYGKRDAKAYMALYTRDVTIRNIRGGTKDRKALEAFVRQDMAATGEIHSAELEIGKVAVEGRKAIVDGVETWKYVFTDRTGEFGPKNASYDVVWRSPARITFLKSPQGWLATSKEATGAETLSTEGRPLAPPAESK